MSLERDEAELREQARLHVRAGLRDADDRYAAMVEAVGTLMPATDPRIMARAWLAAAERELVAEAATWAVPTDHDRWQAAVAECRAHDVAVLEGVDDLARVRHAVESAARPLRGVLWFGERAVWDALTSGVLRAGLRHGNGAVPAVQDPLADAVTGCLQRHGLRARWYEGQVEVLLRWQRRPGASGAVGAVTGDDVRK